MTDLPEEVIKGREMMKEIKKGEWPNFLREAEQTKYPIDLYGAALYLKRDLFTTGGYVSVPGAPTGILMRVTSRPDIGENANVVRVLLPAGNFVTSDMMDKFADFADKYGVGMLHAISTGNDLEIPGIPKDRIKEFVVEFREAGMEIGSTGDAFRATTSCVGTTLCEYANMDTMGLRDDFYDRFNDYAKYPTFPHKMKLKISGCPIDCARATMKGDVGVIGSWDGAPSINADMIKKMSAEKLQEIARACPTGAISSSDHTITINGENCVQCMKCIRLGEGALKAADKKKFLIYVGGKLRGKKGPLSAKLLTKVNTPQEALDLLEKIVEAFADHAARKERLGDLVFRIGMKGFLNLIGLQPTSMNVKDLRTNSFYSVTEEERERIPKEIEQSLQGDKND
ncbi:MAG: hypothetical protein ACP5OC_06815 [Thermoplasmata archaeon]